MKIKCPNCSTSYEIKVESIGEKGRSVRCAKCATRWFVAPAPNRNDDPQQVAEDKADAEWASVAEQAENEEETNNDSSEAFGSDQIEADEDPETGIAWAKEPPPSPPPENILESKLPDPDMDSGPEITDVETSAKKRKIKVNPNKFRKDTLGLILNWLAMRNYARIGGVALFGTAMAVCLVLVLARDNVVKQAPDLASLFEFIGFDVNLRGLEFSNLRTFREVEDGSPVLVVEGSIRNLTPDVARIPAVRLSIRSTDQQEIYAWIVEPRAQVLQGRDETRFRTILTDPPAGAADIQVRFIDRGTRQVAFER